MPPDEIAEARDRAAAPPAQPQPGGGDVDIEDAHRLLLEIVRRRSRQPRPASDYRQRPPGPEQDRRQRTRKLEEARGIGEGVERGHEGGIAGVGGGVHRSRLQEAALRNALSGSCSCRPYRNIYLFRAPLGVAESEARIMVGKFHLPAGARFDLVRNSWRPPPTHIRFSFVPREGADPDEDIVISVGRVLRSSPTYGFTQPDVTPAGPPLKEGEPKIILSPPVIAKGEVVELHNKIDPAEFRSALLLYDRIESPHVSMVVFELGRDAQYLAELGILHRTEPLVPTIQPGECIVKSHLLTMAALEARDGQVWSLARGERSLSLWEADVTAGRGALFELHHAIP